MKGKEKSGGEVHVGAAEGESGPAWGNDSPAAKCRGEDFRPAVSRAFTFCGDTSFLTLETSPLRHASKNSRRGSSVDDDEDDAADEAHPLLLLLLLLWPLLLLLLLPSRSRSLAALMEPVDLLVAIFATRRMSLTAALTKDAHNSCALGRPTHFHFLLFISKTRSPLETKLIKFNNFIYYTLKLVFKMKFIELDVILKLFSLSRTWTDLLVSAIFCLKMFPRTTINQFKIASFCVVGEQSSQVEVDKTN